MPLPVSSPDTTSAGCDSVTGAQVSGQLYSSTVERETRGLSSVMGKDDAVAAFRRVAYFALYYIVVS